LFGECEIFVWEGYDYKYILLMQCYGKSSITRYTDGVKI